MKPNHSERNLNLLLFVAWFVGIFILLSANAKSNVGVPYLFLVPPFLIVYMIISHSIRIGRRAKKEARALAQQQAEYARSVQAYTRAMQIEADRKAKVLAQHQAEHIQFVQIEADRKAQLERRVYEHLLEQPTNPREQPCKYCGNTVMKTNRGNCPSCGASL
jgi:hypothetical protein